MMTEILNHLRQNGLNVSLVTVYSEDWVGYIQSIGVHFRVSPSSVTITEEDEETDETTTIIPLFEGTPVIDVAKMMVDDIKKRSYLFNGGRREAQIQD